MATKNILSNINTSIINNINVGIYRNTPGPQGKFIEVNNALLKMFGYTNKREFLKKVRPADAYVHPQQRKKFSDLLIKKGFVKGKELLLKRRDGKAFYANVTATVVTDARGRVKWFDGIVEDVTAIREEKRRLQMIYEHSPIGIWEEDVSALAKLLKNLTRQGITDIKGYLTKHQNIVKQTFRKIKILDVNKAALAMYGAKSKEQLISNFTKTITRDAYRVVVDEFIALASGKRFFEAEFKGRTLKGKLHDVLLRVSVPDGYEKSFARLIVTIQDITKRKQLERYLKRTAQLDGLTRLLNSRSLSRRLNEELMRARRYNLDLSCLMFDIDYFKTVNDRFGHQKGDQVLKRIARILKKSMRATDIIGRYGGDEFFAILTQTSPENAKVASERIRKLIASVKFRFQKGAAAKITISVGISGYPSEKIKDYRSLIDEADRALYLAKSYGRNCTVLT